jgi:hypothetical protein
MPRTQEYFQTVKVVELSPEPGETIADCVRAAQQYARELGESVLRMDVTTRIDNDYTEYVEVRLYGDIRSADDSIEAREWPGS